LRKTNEYVSKVTTTRREGAQGTGSLNRLGVLGSVLNSWEILYEIQEHHETLPVDTTMFASAMEVVFSSALFSLLVC